MKIYFPLRKIATLGALATMGFVAQASTLVYCSEGSPAGFDPAQYTTGTDFDASAETVFNRLVAFKRGETQVVPALATSWEVSPDGLTYTFHLRKGVKFQTTSYFKPTRDFNAEDVVFTFDRLQNKDNAFNKAYPVQFPYYTDMGMNTTIKSVEAKDPYTVVFHLNHIEAPFLQNLAMPFAVINSKEYADQLLKEGKAPQINQQPVGTGPFVFERYQKDAVIRYKKNPDYWDKEDGPKVDNLIFAITKDTSVRVQKLKRNECQIMSYPLPESIPGLKADPQLKVMQQSGFNVGFLYYNTKKAPLDKPEVRIALDMAINKPELIKAVYQGQATEQANPMPSTQWSYNKSIQSRPYDPKKAKELLAKAGYPNGFEISLWSLPVQRPYNPNGRLMAEMIQADWAKIGVKAKITTYEWGEYVKRSMAGQGDAVMMGWTGDNGDPDNWLGNLFSCSAVSGANTSHWCYKPFEDLIKKARLTTDQAERAKLYEQAQVVWHEQLPASPIASSLVTVPMSKHVEGFKISPFGLFEFTGVSLK